MKLKSYLFASAAILAGTQSYAQTVSHVGHDHHPGEPCISHHVLNDQLQDPETRVRYEAYQEALTRYVNDPATPFIREGGKRIIPVVAHILQMGGNENISKQKVIQQIQTLNQDYQRLNPDTVNTPERFRDVAGRMDVEFRLATKDPLGNCTDGIVRVFTDNTVDVRDPLGFKAISYWNAYSYLNIWIVQSIGALSDLGTVLGYAQFPASGLLSTDGITIISQNIGTAGQGGRTVTHEVGHWLGLTHIWGDAQCGSDQVSDTPIAEGPNFNVCGNVGQANHTTPYNLNVCDPENPEGEMFDNYMDYSSDPCQNIFTAGQVERMNYVLDGNTDAPGIRSYLVSDENLAGTGTADPYDYEAVECAPKPLFHFNQSSFATTAMICEGQDVSFRGNAFNADNIDYSWSFPGGDPATSTATNPNVGYNTAGTYDVTLNVSNTVGANAVTMPGMVVVSSNTAQFQSDWGYYDTFWEESGFTGNYFVFDHDNTGKTWEFYTGNNGGSTGNESVRMLNYDNIEGRVDEFVTPSYNLSTVSSPTLKFRWSGAALNNTPGDQLRIYVSTNCGEGWGAPRVTWKEFDLVNSGVASASYVPLAASIWSDAEVSLGNSAAQSSNVRIKFQWTSGGNGNNFYIDDITISGAPLSAEALEQEIGLNIAPNPTQHSTTISMVLENESKVEVTMMDLTGRKVMDINAGQMAQGAHRFDVDMSAFNAGIYFLRVAVNNGIVVKKVVRN
ncbi:MAG: T9SS type A sorting domain-containing protein [Flavobacteriales bacterium]|nr:T9SS type A sorting domain-containing protein [Flavobacteriales bacterium]